MNVICKHTNYIYIHTYIYEKGIINMHIYMYIYMDFYTYNVQHRGSSGSEAAELEWASKLPQLEGHKRYRTFPTSGLQNDAKMLHSKRDLHCFCLGSLDFFRDLSIFMCLWFNSIDLNTAWHWYPICCHEQIYLDRIHSMSTYLLYMDIGNWHEL